MPSSKTSEMVVSRQKKSAQASALSSLQYYPHADGRRRNVALFYFASLLLLWNVLGHTVLGFEQTFLQPVAATLAALAAQFALEWVEAKSKGRKPRFEGDLISVLAFFAPALISGLAVGMLIYPLRDLRPVIFASVLSIASKVLFRAPSGASAHHFFNPSNFGITVTLLALPWVGVAPPYHFMENVSGIWSFVVPLVILASGMFLHAKVTSRLPLIAAWLSGFAAQALMRHWLFASPLLVMLAPCTSTAFVIFTLYMVPDPATTPLAPSRQVLFGLSVAALYGVLQSQHLVFGLFIALFCVSALRGLGLCFNQRYLAEASAEKGLVLPRARN